MSRVFFNIAGSLATLVPAGVVWYNFQDCFAYSSVQISYWLSHGLWVYAVMLTVGGIASLLTRYGGAVTIAALSYVLASTIQTLLTSLPLPVSYACGERFFFQFLLVGTGPAILSLYYIFYLWTPILGGAIALILGENFSWTAFHSQRN